MEVIKLKMEERGLRPKDLEQIIGSKGYVSSILSGRREITLKMAQKRKNYFQLPLKYFCLLHHNEILKRNCIQYPDIWNIYAMDDVWISGDCKVVCLNQDLERFLGLGGNK